jgi:hypothetical protein
MTTTLAPLAPSVDAAIAALEPARTTYAHFGYDAVLEAELIKRLTTPLIEGVTSDDVAEDMLQLFWSYFPGGSTARIITGKVLKLLGHDALVERGEFF